MMNKFLWLFPALLMLSASAAMAQSGSGRVSAGAALWGVTDDVYSGSYSARLEFTSSYRSGDDTGLDREGSDGANLVSASGGHEIAISFWMRNGRPPTNDLVRLRVATFRADDSFIQDMPDVILAAQDQWAKYTSNFTLPAQTAKINIAFRMFASGGDTVVLDEISAVDVTAASAPLAITNSGFEDWPGPRRSEPTNWRFFAVNIFGPPDPEGFVERVEVPGIVSGVDSFWKDYR